jgi:hypothetical protein
VTPQKLKVQSINMKISRHSQPSVTDSSGKKSKKRSLSQIEEKEKGVNGGKKMKVGTLDKFLKKGENGR